MYTSIFRYTGICGMKKVQRNTSFVYSILSNWDVVTA